MGGVAGHMAHLSEDIDLTFNEIVGILRKVASAEIKNATDKWFLVARVIASYELGSLLVDSYADHAF